MSRLFRQERREREHRLLALCADPGPAYRADAGRPSAVRAADDRAAAETRDLAGETLDWGYLLGAAQRLGALPLLHFGLERSAAPIPPEVDRLGRQARVLNTMRMLVAERQLAEIRGALERASSPCLVLKGLPLAHELYPEPGLRPVGDLDLLVRQRSRDAALAILASLGYRPPADTLPLNFYRRHHFHVLLGRPGGESLPLELHWQPHSFFSLSHVSEEELWASARTLRVGRPVVQVPGLEENYLLLVQHAHRHLMGEGGEESPDAVADLLDPAVQGRLFWISDLILLERCSSLDRDKVRHLAAQWGLERALEEVRGLAARLRHAARGEEEGGRAEVGSVGARGSERARGSGEGYVAARAISRRFPSLARPSRLLHFRLALIGGAYRVAFPGAAWIRRRYGLADAGGARVIARAIVHCVEVASRLIGIGVGALAGLAAKRLRGETTRVDGAFTPPGNCQITVEPASVCSKSD